MAKRDQKYDSHPIATRDACGVPYRYKIDRESLYKSDNSAQAPHRRLLWCQREKAARSTTAHLTFRVQKHSDDLTFLLCCTVLRA